MNFLKIVMAILLLSLLHCKSRQKKEVDAGKARQIVRLTYDVAFYLENTETIENAGTYQDSGNYFFISSPWFRKARLSSYRAENKHAFPYFASADTGMISYDKMPNNTNAYIISLATNSITYLRWEWNYQGKGIVIEAEVDNKNIQGDVVPAFSEWVHNGLKVYY